MVWFEPATNAACRLNCVEWQDELNHLRSANVELANSLRVADNTAAELRLELQKAACVACCTTLGEQCFVLTVGVRAAPLPMQEGRMRSARC